MSTDAFSNGLPAEGRWSRAVQFPILTLPGTLKSVSDCDFPLHFASLYKPPLFPSIPGSWGWLLNWHLPPLQPVPVSSVRPPAHRAIPCCCLQTGKRRCVTQLASTKDKVITAPIVPIYVCWQEEIINLSEQEQGMLESTNQKAVHAALPLLLPICMGTRGRVLRRWGGERLLHLYVKPEINLPGDSCTTAAICSVLCIQNYTALEA